MAFTKVTEEPSLPGLPKDTTLLDFGRWLLTQPPEYVTNLIVSAGPDKNAVADTVKAAIELAQTSTAATSYLRDPVGWIERYVEFPEGEGLTDYQKDALTALAEDQRLALRGPRGLGKSTLGALTVLWFSNTREAAGIDWKLATTASHWGQLIHFLWPEIHKWARRLRWELLGREPFTPYELQTLRLKLTYGEAWGQAAKDANTIEGAHATHIMYLFDEAKIIAPAIWNSTQGAFAGAGPDTKRQAWFLALSVPGPPAGRFYDIHARKKGHEKWRVMHVTKEQAIAAGRMSADWPEEMARLHTVSSALYQQHVEGNFAASASDAVIPLEWVEAAVARWHVLADSGADVGPILAAGLDIARSGGDESVLAMCHQDCVRELVRPDGKTAQKLTAQVKVALAALPGWPIVVVDADGLGAGYFDTMCEGVDWVERVRPFHAGATPLPAKDYTGHVHYANQRAAAWWSLRDELNPDRLDFTPTLALPPDDLLIGDLTTPTYRGVEAGKLHVEEKAEIRKRLGRSTDSGDAVVQARFGLVLGARASVTAAQHTRKVGTPGGDLRRGADAAGPNAGDWSPLTASW